MKDAALEKTVLDENIILYTFINRDAEHSDTITVIHQDGEALLVDTAYPEYAEQVRADLEQQGIRPTVVVLSHYHPDHVSGCSVFPQCEIYAHHQYEYNYGNCQIWEPRYVYIHPRSLVKGGDSLDFGNYHLEFYDAPGHSKCGLIIRITPAIFHIGDLIMITRERKDTLPYISDGGGFQEHIDSLRAVKQLKAEHIFVPHGGLVSGTEEINRRIDDRLFYLKSTLSSRGAQPLEKCLKQPIDQYRHLEFHDTNMLRLL